MPPILPALAYGEVTPILAPFTPGRPPRAWRFASVAARRSDVEAEHHPALVVLGDVAVRHPTAGGRHVEQDVDGLAGSYEPDEVLLRKVVAGEHDEAAGAVDVERVVHRVVGVHLVDQAVSGRPLDAKPRRVREFSGHLRPSQGGSECGDGVPCYLLLSYVFCS
jgi:hypothetical protein